MKTVIQIICILFLIIFILFSCQKENAPDITENNFELTKYNGQVNAEDVTLAKIFSPDENASMYFYGSTNEQGDPVKVKSFSFKRNSSDTIYNYILDSELRIEYMYSIIKGVKDSKLQKLSYSNNDSVYYSIYHYDWETRQDSLLYMAGVAINNGKYSASTLYNKSAALNSFLPGIEFIKANVQVVAGVLLVGAVALAGLAFFKAGAVLTAIGAITIYIAWFGSDAFAGEILSAPKNGEPKSPSAGIILNPVGNPNNPNPCNGTEITFDASMDGFGSIMISNVKGGQPPYEYSLDNSAFRKVSVFNGPYPEKSYLIVIKDARGCQRVEQRPIDSKPYYMSLLSKNNLTGIFGQTLPDPIQVITKDMEGNPVAGQTVNFVANNGGSVSPSHAISGADGIASVFWTLGKTEKSQTLTVTAFKRNNATVQGSPLVIFATAQIGEICTENGTFTDPRDGNIYKTTKIGNQVWMAENLKYLPKVNSIKIPGYLNGQYDSKKDYWNDLITKYYYVYNYEGSDINEAKSSENYKNFGVLYNYAAAAEACPPGWHLPDYSEWMELAEFITKTKNLKGIVSLYDGSFYWSGVGPYLQSKDCFSATLGGVISEVHGTAILIYDIGHYWTSTTGNFGGFYKVDKDDIRTAFSVLFSNGIRGYNNHTFYFSDSYKNGEGYSIRCIKD